MHKSQRKKMQNDDMWEKLLEGHNFTKPETLNFLLQNIKKNPNF